ncbi:type IV pilin protein [Nitrococcus mobilis]|uniref:Type 4 fimbrial biogenesis protein PilE n=1 Tax=Nitrococcus mobilis Nb-231 TaxID=314278 RepID=A4BTT9_9GAMM|nr:type IV pilin protein [Nitrococcus mobilis]EAR20903.1 type 4 fimbrial biogenesis protein PilE [Nitrococcus mobilis Nb-231]
MREKTSRRHTNGFTLIELMITVAIVAIIAAIAYPSYTRHVIKSHRSTGQGKLLEIMQAQERYFTINNSYTADLTDLGYGAASAVPADGGWYTVAAAACTASTINQCVLLTATPQNSQTADSTCGNLTLSSRGQKGISGTGSVGECW